MIPEKIGFIGLGHIGGSVAKTVHRIYPDIQIVAYDTCRATLDTALQEGVISEALDQVGKGFSDCNYIYLCAPVLDNADYVRELSGILHDDMLLTDVGSGKTGIQRLSQILLVGDEALEHADTCRQVAQGFDLDAGGGVDGREEIGGVRERNGLVRAVFGDGVIDRTLGQAGDGIGTAVDQIC